MFRTFLCTALLATAAGAQTTWYVDVAGIPPGSGTQLDPYTSIDHALQQPSTLSGDTVLVAPGTYFENVTFPGRGVSVLSTHGAAVTTIDGQGSGSVVSLLSTDGTAMALKGFKITGGTGTSPSGGFADRQGGGILARDCIARVVDCVIENNTAFEGGGVYAVNSDLEVRGSTVRDNTVLGTQSSPSGGGLMFTGGTAKMRLCVIQSNEAGTPTHPGEGGGIFAAGPLTVRQCSIADNVAERQGGGIHGAAEIIACRVVRNTSQAGGGIYGAALVRRSSIQDNLADSSTGTNHYGGGVYGAATLVDCYLEGNAALGEGGGAHGATLVRCTLVGNEARFSQTFPSEGGGAMSCTLTDCVLLDNLAFGSFGSQGGGASRSTLVDCVLAGNETQPGTGFSSSQADGGGAFLSALTGCEVIGNSAGGLGGGVYGGSTYSTTLIGNSASSGGGAADAALERTTVFDNTAAVGADGVHVGAFASGSLLDSIVWGNGTWELNVEPNGTLGVTYTDVLGGWPGTGNIDADPLFWNPATGDVHLQAGSPCIDAGDPNSPLDPDGTRADMGAHPFDPSYQG